MDHLVRDGCHSWGSRLEMWLCWWIFFPNILLHKWMYQVGNHQSSNWVIRIICSCVQKKPKNSAKISKHIVSYLLLRLLELSFIKKWYFQGNKFLLLRHGQIYHDLSSLVPRVVQQGVKIPRSKLIRGSDRNPYAQFFLQL